MNNKPQDELLTAYLDDELSPEERADVERMLAESASSRQLLEELKALRSTLQSLPQDRLEPDFSKQVMQIAERSMLVGPSPETGDASASTAPHPSTRKAKVRPAPDQDWGQRLVRPLAFAGLAIAAALAVMVLQPDQVANQDAARGIAREDDLDRPPALEAAPDLSGADRAREGTPLGVADDEPAFRAPSSSQPKAAMSKGGGAGFAKESETAVETAPVAEGRDEAHSPEDPLGQTAVTTPDIHALNFQRSKQLVNQQSLFQSNAAAPVYSVQLDVTPEAARSRVLDKTLERNRIKVTTAATRQADVDEASEVKISQGIAPIDVVYVELTQSQLESVLTDIADQPDQFSNIMVPTNPAFVGQKPMPDEAGAWFLSEETQSQRAVDVRAQPTEPLEGAAARNIDGAEAPEASTKAPAPEGVAQRVQLPPISGKKLYAGRKMKDGQAASSPETTELEREQKKDTPQPERNEEQALSHDLEFLGGGGGVDLNDQMFRALFILRVVPELEEAKPEVEPSTESESNDSEQP